VQARVYCFHWRKYGKVHNHIDYSTTISHNLSEIYIHEEWEMKTRLGNINDHQLIIEIFCYMARIQFQTSCDLLWLNNRYDYELYHIFAQQQFDNLCMTAARSDV
jgi:hypothetical protein